MIVQKTSVFPAGRDAVFQKLQKLETLQYIAWPFATFEPVGNAVLTWTVGSTSSYRFRLFGVIPFGTHTIPFVQTWPEVLKKRGILSLIWIAGAAVVAGLVVLIS